MRKLTAALALSTVAVALTVGTPGSATAAPGTPGPAQHLALDGWTLLNEHGPGPNPGERLTAWVSARTVDGHARGHVVLQHVFGDGSSTRPEFDVDCLTVDASGAVTVTGPIAQTVVTPPGGQPYLFEPGRHPEAGLTFYPADDQHQRRVGFAVTNAEVHSEVVKCGAVPAGFWIIEGGAVLRGTDRQF
ncbi:hypothetical protein [Kitasatospora viridis]|uniref:Uncharacterized protein n=1 Tax=Kitasatospora viridis TaxID=281105 RepID=A0A561UP02_9ACTN|nr:hypothetical protein [Kitasatospora viridis]TWG01106.1 hypothetical protein FHX73_114993 [Kitasatospora viridis]